jgi:AcrR family transcriptional regulator
MTQKSVKPRRKDAALKRVPVRAPMAASAPRVRRRRKEARPGEILEAAYAIFIEHGFAAARLEDVAKRAGIAKGTIYRYFADKEALFLAVMQGLEAPVFEQVDEFITQFPGPTDDLLALAIRQFYSGLVQGNLAPLLRIILAEGPQFPVLAETHYNTAVAAGQSLLGKIIKRGIARGEVRAGAVERFPMMLMAPAAMAILWSLLFEKYQPLDLQAYIEAHIDLVLNGIRR